MQAINNTFFYFSSGLHKKKFIFRLRKKFTQNKFMSSRKIFNVIFLSLDYSSSRKSIRRLRRLSQIKN
ncbi:MAG: hypothetical protein B6244_10690 [Candidatus Cloacimonetes bacterium 4572_55]|nr:MAG: hypothetical protein B6244_10690 [Candidatus Cloacimonetes bacterium 4572_55]